MLRRLQPHAPQPLGAPLLPPIPQVARAELDTVQGQVAVAQDAAGKKGQEIRCALWHIY